MSKGKRRAEEELQPYSSRQLSPPGRGSAATSVGTTSFTLPNGGGGSAGPLPPNGIRAASCLQHVRALNSQFLSWVQRQQKEHPDELWMEGVEDYTRHATKILAEFKDVVDWLKATANGSLPPQQTKTEDGAPHNGLPKASVSPTTRWPPPSETAARGSSLSDTTSFRSLDSFTSGTPGSQTAREAGTVQELSTKRRTPGSLASPLSTSPPRLPPLPASAWAGLTVAAPGADLSGGGLFGGLIKSGNDRQSPAVPEAVASGGDCLAGGTTGAGSNRGVAPVTGGGGSSAASISSWTMPGKGAPLVAPGSGTTSFGAATAGTTTVAPLKVLGPKIEEAEEGADGEEPEPDSPSLKKGAEPGVQVLYEIRAKLYVQGGEKGWRDMGVGTLSLKQYPSPDGKEGLEPPPRIMFRTEVGRLLMNALLYSDIKATVSKKQVTLALFSVHEEPSEGAESPEQPGKAHGAQPGGGPVRTTYALKMASEGTAKELSSKILEYAPKS